MKVLRTVLEGKDGTLKLSTHPNSLLNPDQIVKLMTTLNMGILQLFKNKVKQ